MQLLTITNGIPVYLPYDTAPNPFGEPFTDVTFTVASPGVFTVPGYDPTAGDEVAFSSTGTLPTGITVGTTYYVVNPSADTFEVSATKGGGAITIIATGTGTLTMHLLLEQAQTITLPFKPNNTVLAYAYGAASVVLQSAPDTGGGSGDPQGPGSWTTIATIAEYSFALVTLNNDWLQVSTGSGVVQLIQN